jgi:hypothetical protein
VNPSPSDVHRYGNEWMVTWPQVRLHFAKVREVHAELLADLMVECISEQGWLHVAGPVKVNLLSLEGQSRTGGAIGKRNNEYPWYELISTATAIVAVQWNAPPPYVRARDMLDTGPLKWLVPGLVLESETSMLYGDGASAKSMLALLIAICVASGTSLPWGTRPNRRLRVLYADWETNDETFGRRLRRLCAGLGIEVPEDLIYVGTIASKPEAAILRALADEVDNLRGLIAREGIGLVVTDSVGFMVNGKLSDDDIARGAMNNLRLLGGVTRLAVHHISRESALRQAQQPGRVDPFGSIYFRNGARSGFEVRKSEEQSVRDSMHLGIYQHKANDTELLAPFALRVVFVPDGAVRFEPCALHEASDIGQRASVQDQILDVLARRGPCDTRKIAFLIGRPDAAGQETVRGTLARLLKSGQVRQLQPGSKGNPAVWELVPEGPVTDVPEPFRNVFGDDFPDPLGDADDDE